MSLGDVNACFGPDTLKKYTPDVISEGKLKEKVLFPDERIPAVSCNTVLPVMSVSAMLAFPASARLKETVTVPFSFTGSGITDSF